MPVYVSVVPSDLCPKCKHNLWIVWKGKLVCLYCDAPNILTDKDGKRYRKTEIIKGTKHGKRL